MKHFVFPIILLACFLAGYLHAAEINERDVVQCQNEQEVKEAKAKGLTYFKVGNYYYVRIGSEYKGPFRKFEQAKKLRKDFEVKAKKAGVDLSVFQDETPGAILNPRLVTFPFIDYHPESTMLFHVPGDKVVEASKVMIHPEPLYYENIVFGPILLKDSNPYFAVTGSITPRQNVQFSDEGLSLWVGAAVISEDGSILWKDYGEMDEELGFKCIQAVDSSTSVPNFLLLFTIAKGNLPTALTTVKDAEPFDTSAYDYHILCSAMLEVAPNWCTPIDEAIKEEYKKIKQDEVKEEMKGLKKSNKSESNSL